MRDERRRLVDPQMRPRIAAFGWTAQFVFAIAQAADFQLAAVKFSFADKANALVVERGPVSKSIFGAQDREAIVEFKMCDHNAKSSLLIASKRTIGTVDGCVIG
jgi:hypothetical protein